MPNQEIIVFGAGIAGLSAAHYLTERGYSVTVIESLAMPGGLARSERISTDSGMPSEYSWRGFGQWYHNTYDLLKKIPLGSQTVYDTELSPPINFLLINDKDNITEDSKPYYTKSNFLTKYETVKLGLLFSRISLSCQRRRREQFSKINASRYLSKHLSPLATKRLSWLFGPWGGSDASRVSLNQVELFFRRTKFPGSPAPYYFPSFKQGGGSGWLILRRPSNESWFNPWVEYLKSKGVKFYFNTSLEKLNVSNHQIVSALVKNNDLQRTIVSDQYVLATNPYSAKTVLERSGLLSQDLAVFKGLVADYPHAQVSFRIVFPERVNLYVSKEHTAVILMDSEFDITLFSQNQLWNDDVYLGQGVKSLWSGTATIDSNPGRLYGLPFIYLTKEQFIEELKAQIFGSQSLDELIKKNNNGCSLKSFPVSKIEVWHTWTFPQRSGGPERLVDRTQPKWVNNTRNEPFLPETKTSISNLFLAGAHTRTNADLYSMEAAVESGRRAADIISGIDTVIPQHVPLPLQLFQAIDCVLYSIGLPPVTDIILLIIIIYILLRIIKYLTS